MNKYIATYLASGLLIGLSACQKSAKKDAFGQDYNGVPASVIAGSQPGASGTSSADIGSIPTAAWKPLAAATDEAAATTPLQNTPSAETNDDAVRSQVYWRDASCTALV